MKTNSYHYNQAVKKSQQRQSVTLEEVKKDIESEQDIEVYPPKGARFCYDIDISETYNSTCADMLLEKLKIEPNEKRKDVAESYIYNTKGQDKDIKKIRQYHEMVEAGYISCHDITEDMDGKTALLTGTVTMDWLSSKKEDEKVKLVCKDNKKGYQKPRQRTRYYPFAIDQDLFIKLIK